MQKHHSNQIGLVMCPWMDTGEFGSVVVSGERDSVVNFVGDSMLVSQVSQSLDLFSGW